MVTYSPTALFALVRLIEALVAIQGACDGLWQQAAQSITPLWLRRHMVLREKLKEIGVTHRFDLHQVQAFKRHIVETQSDPMWRRAWWIMCLVTILGDKFTTCLVCGVIGALCIIASCLFGSLSMMAWVTIVTLVGAMIVLENQHLIAQALADKIKTDSFFRDYVKWHSRDLDELLAEERDVPTQALRISEAVSALGGHISVDDAIKGEVYVDPLLYVSAVPMWVSCIPGLRFLRICVLQWGDDEFETGGFAAKARRPL